MVKSLKVNSAHNESIRETVNGLRINAIAPDGVIEGIEATDKYFCLGVQWHPEFFLNEGNPNLNLIKGLINFSARKSTN